jgi:RNA polymerase sigma factor (TIGR02999 family)
MRTSPPSNSLLDDLPSDHQWQRQEVTRLLTAWRGGDQQAFKDLTPLVYQELRFLAQRYMRRERNGHTLQATAVVHEAFVRMVDMNVAWQDRSHFLAMAATMMRRILVDHAKGKRRVKRGGGAEIQSLDETNLQVISPEPGNQFDVVEIDATLTQLAMFAPRLAQVIELHYFGGLTVQEIGTALSLSDATVHRDMRLAKAWMLKELHHLDEAHPSSGSSSPNSKGQST